MEQQKRFWQLVATVAEVSLKKAAMALAERDFVEAQRQVAVLDKERKRLVEEMGFDPDEDYYLNKEQETLIPMKKKEE